MQAAENTKIWSSRRYTGEQVVCTYVLGDTFPRFFDVQRTLPKQGNKDVPLIMYTVLRIIVCRSRTRCGHYLSLRQLGRGVLTHKAFSLDCMVATGTK